MSAILPEHQKRVIFDNRFWPLYPRKIAKKDALKAFCKEVTTMFDVETCCANTAKWKPVLEARDPEHIPYPGRFLRRGDWQDPPPNGMGKRLRSAVDEMEGL